MDIERMLSGQPEKAFAEPTTGHVSLGRSLRAILFLIPVLIVVLYPVELSDTLGAVARMLAKQSDPQPK